MTGEHESFFIKLTERHSVGRKMAESEFRCSELLYRFAAPGMVPRPLGWGTFETEPALSFYMCEFVELIDERFPAPAQIAPLLAEMHLKSQADAENPGKFGFGSVTCAGPIEQRNDWNASWEVFFAAKLRDLLDMDEGVHGSCTEYEALRPALFDKVIPRLLRPLQSQGRTITPVFCHGDLWHCNSALRAHPASSSPLVIFDPASFWAHNEYDLYMMHSPRYVFNSEHVKEYRRHFPPSEPVEDCDDRLLLYTLVSELGSSITYPASKRYRVWAVEKIQTLVDRYPDGYTGPS